MAKRKARLEDLLSYDVSRQKLSNILRSAEKILAAGDTLPSSYGLQRLMEDSVDISTPYGKVLQTIRLPSESGTYDWEVVNPFAFLYEMCRRSPAFAKLIAQHCNIKPCRLVFYSDGLTMGNGLNNNVMTKSQCMYWSIMELPHWFICRAWGWFVFGVLPEPQVEKLQWGMSTVFIHMLKVFYSLTGHNLMRTGVCLNVAAGAPKLILYAVPDSAMQDYEAFRDVFCIKGASGLKFCACCKNFTRLVDWGDHPYYRDFKSATLVDADLHTKESVYEMVDLLSTAAQTMPTTSVQFANKEKACGLNYSPGSLLWDLELRQYIDAADFIFIDWYHCLCASGGVAQYEGNEYIRAIITHTDITLDDLDNFMATVSFPHRHHGFKPGSLGVCWTRKENAPWKYFATDTYEAIVALKAFTLMVLVPSGRLGEHTKCFLLLCTILDIYFMGDNAVGFVDILEASQNEHFRLFVKLYRECAKPKLHLHLHIPPKIKQKRKNLSAAAPERHHKRTKAHGVRAYGHELVAKHVIRKLLLECMGELSKDSRFMACYLVEPRVANHMELFSSMFKAHECIIGLGLQTPIGCVWRDDVISAGPLGQWEDVVCAVHVLFGVQTRLLEMHKLFALCERMQEGSHSGLWVRSGVSCIIPAENITALLPYVPKKDGFFILFPRV